jgi:hypothetical protein
VLSQVTFEWKGQVLTSCSKKILPFIDPKATKICEFEEGEGGFVGEFEAGAKL